MSRDWPDKRRSEKFTTKDQEHIGHWRVVATAYFNAHGADHGVRPTNR